MHNSIAGSSSIMLTDYQVLERLQPLSETQTVVAAIIAEY